MVSYTSTAIDTTVILLLLLYVPCFQVTTIMELDPNITAHVQTVVQSNKRCLQPMPNGYKHNNRPLYIIVLPLNSGLSYSTYLEVINNNKNVNNK